MEAHLVVPAAGRLPIISACITGLPASGRHYQEAPGKPGALPYLRWSALASRTARNDSSLLQFGQLRELAS